MSGATTGIGNFGDGGTATSIGPFGLPGMAQEFGSYLFSSGGIADPNALYLVWGGANDFLTGDSLFLAAQNIASYVGTLATAGAEHILVPNLPDLSLTPFGQTLVPFAQAFSIGFNAELATQLGSLSALFPATDIIQFDIFSLFNDVVLNPVEYGFTNAEDSCLLLACTDPENYLFWDDFHPTTEAHAEIASAFVVAVPEPQTIMLLMGGLLSLAVAGRRSRRTARA